MRLLVLILALVSTRATAEGLTCKWAEPASAAKLDVADGAARFTWPLAESWFSCAREHGGAMEVVFLLRDANGIVRKAKTVTRTRADAAEAISLPNLCESPGASAVQVRVVGTGPMDRLLSETPFVPLHCFSCPSPGDVALSADMASPGSPAGFVTVRGRVSPEFHDCAKAAGGTLALRVFVGQTQEEAASRRDHTFILRGLERDAAFRKAFAPTNPCLEGKFVGLEYFGTGEFRQLNTQRRRTLPLICPKSL